MLLLQVAETAASLKFSHEQRDGGCSVEVFLAHRSAQVTMDAVRDGRHDSVILRDVKKSKLVKLFRNPGARMVYRWPNPYYVSFNLTRPDARRFFMSAGAPVDGTLASVSLGAEPSTYFLLYRDGSFAYSAGVPPELHARLAGRQAWRPRPELARLGLRSPDTFFLQFTDGAMEWGDLPRQLEELLLATAAPVEELALGEADDYFVRLRDGREAWCLPETLADMLEQGRTPGAAGEVAAIALGEHGDFYVRLVDGTSHGRATQGARAALGMFRESNDTMVQLGREGEFVVVGRRKNLVEGRRKRRADVEEEVVSKRRRYEEERPGDGVEEEGREELEGGCTCERAAGLVICRRCGESTAGRVRRACPGHPTAVHSTDVWACAGCGEADAAMLEEHRLEGGGLPNTRVIG